MMMAPDQYDLLRKGRGFVALPSWTSITLTGADRQKFLHSFCTNDVKRLAPGESCEAFITNVKGKVLAHGLVDCRENELVFITVPDQAVGLSEHLDRYIIREDVQLRDSTAERVYSYVSETPPQDDQTAARWIPWSLLGRAAGGLFEVAHSDAARFALFLIANGFQQSERVAFETLRIEAGTPLFGVDFDTTNLPQEVARNDRAICFTKGCYLGQETVARIDALGHVNQEIRGVRFDGAAIPERGTLLTHSRAPAGHVTSATYSPRLKAPLALAMIRRNWLAAGSRLDSAVGSCEVVTLPAP